jgi:hypothetical protein
MQFFHRQAILVDQPKEDDKERSLATSRKSPAPKRQKMLMQKQLSQLALNRRLKKPTVSDSRKIGDNKNSGLN